MTSPFLHVTNVGPRRRPSAIARRSVHRLVSTNRRVNTVRNARGSVIGGVFRFSSAATTRVVAPHASIATISMRSPIDRTLATYIRGKCSHLPMCRRSISRVVNVLCVGSLLPCINGPVPRAVALHDLLHSARFMPSAGGYSSLFRRVGRGRLRVTVIMSRCNNITNVIAVRSLLRSVINGLRSRFSGRRRRIARLRRGIFRISNSAGVDSLDRHLSMRLPRNSCSALTNFLVSRLNRVPRPSRTTTIACRGIAFAIRGVSSHHVRRILMHVRPHASRRRSGGWSRGGTTSCQQHFSEKIVVGVGCRGRLSRRLGQLRTSKAVPQLLLRDYYTPYSDCILRCLDRSFTVAICCCGPGVAPTRRFQLQTSRRRHLVHRVPLPQSIRFLRKRCSPTSFATVTGKLRERPRNNTQYTTYCHLQLRTATGTTGRRDFSCFAAALSVDPLGSTRHLGAVNGRLTTRCNIPCLFSSFGGHRNCGQSYALTTSCELCQRGCYNYICSGTRTTEQAPRGRWRRNSRYGIGAGPNTTTYRLNANLTCRTKTTPPSNYTVCQRHCNKLPKCKYRHHHKNRRRHQLIDERLRVYAKNELPHLRVPNAKYRKRQTYARNHHANNSNSNNNQVTIRPHRHHTRQHNTYVSTN